MAIVTMEGEYETAQNLSNGTSLKKYSTSNNLKMVQHTAIFTMANR